MNGTKGTRPQINTSIPPASALPQPRISRYTGGFLTRASRRLWMSLMTILCWGSLCQQPCISRYTSLGQVRGLSSSRPCVMHSMACWKKKEGALESSIIVCLSVLNSSGRKKLHLRDTLRLNLRLTYFIKGQFTQIPPQKSDCPTCWTSGGESDPRLILEATLAESVRLYLSTHDVVYSRIIDL